jgi:hypothetical protein
MYHLIFVLSQFRIKSKLCVSRIRIKDKPSIYLHTTNKLDTSFLINESKFASTCKLSTRDFLNPLSESCNTWWWIVSCIWGKISRLIRKRYIHNVILIEPTIYCIIFLNMSQSVLDINLKILNTLRHLF